MEAQIGSPRKLGLFLWALVFGKKLAAQGNTVVNVPNPISGEKNYFLWVWEFLAKHRVYRCQRSHLFVAYKI